jgi:hypothetical protein
MRVAWFAAVVGCVALGLFGPAANAAQASSGPGEVVTEPAEATPTGVKLKGRLNPEGLQTTYEFEYSASGCDGYWNYCVERTKTGVVSGDTQQEVPAVEVTGLVAGETYSYKLFARNTGGEQDGEWVNFTVPESGQGPWRPSALVEPAAVTVAGVQLKGKVDPGGLPTTYYFQYNSVKTAVSGPLTGDTMQEVSVEVTGLAAGQYRYELIATNADGTSHEGDGFEFTVGAPTAPLIESESASHLTQTDATLEAKINPDGLVEPHSQGQSSGADYQFQLVKNTGEYLQEMFCTEAGAPQPVGYGCGGNWGTGPDVIPLGGGIGEGSTGQHVSLDLAGAGVTLRPGTTYHYRVLAARSLPSEEGGVHWASAALVGPDRTFTTPPAGAAPEIDSVSISHVTSTDGTLEAQINTEGLSTLYQFHLIMQPLSCMAIPACLGQTYSLPSGLLLGSFLEQSVSLDLNSAGVALQVGREYAYWVSATSTAGTTEGAHQMFRVPSEEAEPLSSPASSLSGAGQSAGPGGGGQPAGGSAGSSSSSSPGVRAHGAPVGKTSKPATPTGAHKLSSALLACQRKPKRQRASCDRRAHRKYRMATVRAAGQARGKK